MAGVVRLVRQEKLKIGSNSKTEGNSRFKGTQMSVHNVV